ISMLVSATRRWPVLGCIGSRWLVRARACPRPHAGTRPALLSPPLAAYCTAARRAVARACRARPTAQGGEGDCCLGCHDHAEAAERPRVELADARLRDCEHAADLLERALL